MKGLKQLILATLCLLALHNDIATAKIVHLDRILAVANKVAIMESEVDARIQSVYRQLKGKNIPLPPESILKEQVIEQLIIENIQISIGKNAGVRIDDWTLNEAINTISERNNLSVPDFKKKLEDDGISFASAREEIRNEMIIRRVRQRVVAERIHVSEQEIDLFLKSPEGKSQIEVEILLAHILIPTPDNASPQQIKNAEKQAKSVVAQINDGASFAEMAISYSKDQNALNGGNIGWRKSNQLPSLFAEHALKMSKGQVSAPVRSAGGFHIFKLLDSRGNQKVLQEQVHVRHIIIKPNEIRSDFEAQMLAKKVHQRIIDGENFEDLAKVYSDDTVSIVNGGDLHWLNRTSMPWGEEFKTTMNSIPHNTISNPFKGTYGWHIMEVLGKQDLDVSGQLLRDKIREFLGSRKFEEELAVWLREIRDEAYVEIRL